MLKSLKLLTIFAALVAISGCVVTNEQKGAVIGGVTGGLLGNTIGKGSGKNVATGVGALIGTVVGATVGGDMDARNPTVSAAPPPASQASSVSGCSTIKNDGVRAACERGAAERNAQIQREAEDRAYRCARFGNC